MSFQLVSSSTATDSPRPFPWKDLQKQMVEVIMLSAYTGEIRVVSVVYDPANKSLFEVKICITCGARSQEEDPYKTLIHKNCQLEQIVVTVGDNIGVQPPSCFEGILAKNLNSLFSQLQQKHIK